MNIRILTNTFFNLSANQIVYRVWYLIKRRIIAICNITPLKDVSHKSQLNAKYFKRSHQIEGLVSNKVRFCKDSFSFSLLNTTISYKNDIGWNADFLNRGTRLLKLQLHSQKYLLELALRPSESNNNTINIIINSWLKFNNYIDLESYKGPWNSYCASNRIITYIIIDAVRDNKGIDEIIEDFPSVVLGHYRHIKNNLEFDIRGNHLLENYIALCFCSIFLEQRKEFEKNFKGLIKVLNCQILKDGGHYELSSMYHSILVKKLLDLSNYLLSNQFYSDEKLNILESYCYRMIRWFESIHLNSHTPLLNDSVESETICLNQLLNLYQLIFNKAIDFKKDYFLSESGFRKYKSDKFEVLIKVGNVGAKEVPGHAHADTFNTIISNNKGIIFTDPGVSTYNNNNTRFRERSTEYHNTVSLEGVNSSQIWSSFRMGRQCKSKILEQSNRYYKAIHDGYLQKKVMHQREWSFDENKILITDTLIGKAVNKKGVQNWILQPNIDPILNDNEISTDELTMKFHGKEFEIIIDEIEIPLGFNLTSTTNRLRITFLQCLSTEIKFK